MQANFSTRCLLAFGSCAAGPIDPQDIEDTLRVMNERRSRSYLKRAIRRPICRPSLSLPDRKSKVRPHSGTRTSAIGAAQLSPTRKGGETIQRVWAP